mmetsp:Transcript_11843/g.29199  ORF Transcript_11843/g.29199 Transcript_11843/m.29199 type:complete len:86 (-) Transcript_11843:161-418(-)
MYNATMMIDITSIVSTPADIVICTRFPFLPPREDDIEDTEGTDLRGLSPDLLVVLELRVGVPIFMLIIAAESQMKPQGRFFGLQN